MLVLTNPAFDEPVQIHVNEAFEIHLNESRTTGFLWEVDETGKGVCFIERETASAGTERIGQGGEHVWRLRADKPGECRYRFTYVRPLERAAVARTVTVRVRVAP